MSEVVSEPGNMARERALRHAIVGGLAGALLASAAAADLSRVAPTRRADVPSPISVHVGSPDVAMDGEGRFVVVWNSYYTYYSLIDGRRFDAAGRHAGEPFEVSRGRLRSSLGPVSVDVDGAGGFRSTNQFRNVELGDGADVEHLDSADEKVGSFALPDDDGGYGVSHPHIAQGVGAVDGFAVVWSHYGDVRVQRYDAADAEIDEPIEVSSGQNSYSSVAAGPGGEFAVAWRGYFENAIYAIMLRRYAPDGAPRGDAIRVNLGSSGYLLRPSIAIAPDGRIAVAWTNNSGIFGNDDHSIRARIFSADGESQGGEFQINEGAIVPYQDPDLAAVDGGFVVVWSSGGDEALGEESQGVQARHFSWEATALGPERRIGTDCAVGHPAVSSNGGDRAVFAWGASVCESDSGIYSALYQVPEPSPGALAAAALLALALCVGGTSPRGGARSPR